MNKIMKLCVIFLLVVVTVNPAAASYSEEYIHPRASLYISGCTASLKCNALGTLTISGYIESEDYVQDIGVYTISIFESDDNNEYIHIATLSASNSPSFVGHNKTRHTFSINYQGTPGKYYKASVKLQVTTYSSQTEARYIWVGPKQTI